MAEFGILATPIRSGMNLYIVLSLLSDSPSVVIS